MDPYVAILGTLAGVIVGGLVNFLATRSVKQQEWRLTLARDQITQRQRIYAEFLAEAQRLMVRAIYKPLEVPNDIQVLEGLLAQITLTAPDPVIERARELRRHMLLPGSQGPDADSDTPTWRQLRTEFVAAAKADLERYGSDA